MTDKNVLNETKSSLWFWQRYYHILIYIHFILGVCGVVIGALIAADFGANTDSLIPDSKTLGVISAVIVGIVSFLQPGRMASVFFDAYTNLRIAILRSYTNPDSTGDLVKALEQGYATVATIQPKRINKQTEVSYALDTSSLSDESRKMIAEKMSELIAAEKAKAAAKAEQTPAAEKPVKKVSGA